MMAANMLRQAVISREAPTRIHLSCAPKNNRGRRPTSLLCTEALKRDISEALSLQRGEYVRPVPLCRVLLPVDGQEEEAALVLTLAAHHLAVARRRADGFLPHAQPQPSNAGKESIKDVLNSHAAAKDAPPARGEPPRHDIGDQLGVEGLVDNIGAYDDREGLPGFQLWRHLKLTLLPAIVVESLLSEDGVSAHTLVLVDCALCPVQQPHPHVVHLKL
mmetsp:Transcript_19067/g.53132  ORF Transcript_19067/g.53132 Transcript_19067/m.53132 type:complete len:218 (-) Transcript_19067:737-1390(-)